MSLSDWQNNSWLVAHDTSAEEIAALLAIVERDLANAGLTGLAEDWKLNIAYNAALQAATAALAAAGYRAAREQHHYRTIQSLALTINWPADKLALTTRGVDDMAARSLRLYRQFFLTYENIWQALPAKSRQKRPRRIRERVAPPRT